jgi:hypothetical protein
MKKNHVIITSTVLIAVICLTAFLFFAQQTGTASIYGKYLITSNDPMIQRSVQNQRIYLLLNKNNTIAYNTTINGKRKYDFSGTYILDKKNNTLTIAWLGGKLPKQLKVEKEGGDYIIRIGETIYKKEKEKS